MWIIKINGETYGKENDKKSNNYILDICNW